MAFLFWSVVTYLRQVDVCPHLPRNHITQHLSFQIFDNQNVLSTSMIFYIHDILHQQNHTGMYSINHTASPAQGGIMKLEDLCLISAIKHPFWAFIHVVTLANTSFICMVKSHTSYVDSPCCLAITHLVCVVHTFLLLWMVRLHTLYKHMIQVLS